MSIVYYDHFLGNRISEYGLQNGYIDYLTLSKSFDHVLCNDIIKVSFDWETYNGSDFYEDEYGEIYIKEIYQYYIISESGAEILSEYTDEIVFYNYEFNLYVWGVTHFGTGWDYVLTNIPCTEIRRD